MGILDDAIREHLDLKRKHGARESELDELEDDSFGSGDRPDAFTAGDFGGGEGAPGAPAAPVAEPPSEPALRAAPPGAERPIDLEDPTAFVEPETTPPPASAPPAGAPTPDPAAAPPAPADA